MKCSKCGYYQGRDIGYYIMTNPPEKDLTPVPVVCVCGNLFWIEFPAARDITEAEIEMLKRDKPDVWRYIQYLTSIREKTRKAEKSKFN